MRSRLGGGVVSSPKLLSLEEAQERVSQLMSFSSIRRTRNDSEEGWKDDGWKDEGWKEDGWKEDGWKEDGWSEIGWRNDRTRVSEGGKMEGGFRRGDGRGGAKYHTVIELPRE